MIQKQEEYVNLLSQAIEALKQPNVELPTENLENVQQSIKEQELLIPIIGDFSAGKSSLLNSFLGAEKILPTDVRPETSIAAELRYDTNERIEAIVEDKVVKTYGLNDFEEIKAKASEYNYIKVYLNNEHVKSIEPLILVDMPGFESPVEQHNKAINIYLSRGAHFVVLVNAQDGTLHRSAFRRLNDIMECDRDFSLVISKENLVSAENLKDVSKGIAEQIDDELDVKKIPTSVGKDGSVAFRKIIDSLEPDALFTKIAKPIVKNTLYDAKSSINIKLSSLEHSGEQNNAVIEKLKDALKKIQAKEESLLKEVQSPEQINSRVKNIVSKVGQELSSSVDSLASIAVKQGGDAASKEISDIVQSTLLPLVKTSVSEMVEEIDAKLSVEIQDVNGVLSEYSNNEDFIGTASEGIKTFLENSMASLNNYVKQRQVVKEDATKFYNAITGVLAITTNFVAPVVELAIVFLPQILGLFTDMLQKKKQQAAEIQRMNEVKSQILTSVIPSVKRNVQSKVQQILQDEAESLVTQITQEYETILEAKQKEIDAAEKERQEHVSELNERIEALKSARTVIESAYNSACQ